MKNNIITIIKKEFKRFFGDKRMVVTTLLMPGLLIYVVYSFMGNAMNESLVDNNDVTHTVEAVNMPEDFKVALKQTNYDIKDVDTSSVEAACERIKNEELDMFVAFPEDFVEDIVAYDSATGGEAPNVEIYYNSAAVQSSGAYNTLVAILDSYESTLTNKFNINAGDIEYDQATEEDSMASVISMMLPMLLLIFIYSGCVAVAPESIAGEKERGTIATLLVTPMKRSQLAFGKIISLSIIGLLCGCSSFIGVMLSLPKLMVGADPDMNMNIYKVNDYIMLLLVVLSTVLLLIAVISIISALSKSVKEASTAVIPLMILVMLAGVGNMMNTEPVAEFYMYLIPIYNSVQSMNGVFSFHMDMTNLIITVVSNIVYAGVLSFVLSKIFDSEKIMYI